MRDVRQMEWDGDGLALDEAWQMAEIAAIVLMVDRRGRVVRVCLGGMLPAAGRPQALPRPAVGYEAATLH